MRARGPDDADARVRDGQLLVLLQRLAECVQAVADELLERACGAKSARAWRGRDEGRRALTVHEAFIVLLEVGLGALGARTDGHGVVFIRVAGWGEFVQVGALFVLADHK